MVHSTAPPSRYPSSLLGLHCALASVQCPPVFVVTLSCRAGYKPTSSYNDPSSTFCSRCGARPLSASAQSVVRVTHLDPPRHEVDWPVVPTEGGSRRRGRRSGWHRRRWAKSKEPLAPQEWPVKEDVEDNLYNPYKAKKDVARGGA